MQQGAFLVRRYHSLVEAPYRAWQVAVKSLSQYSRSLLITLLT